MTINEFKSLREKLGLTQQEFGEKLGFATEYARNRVSEIERGVKKISRPVQIIAEFLSNEVRAKKKKTVKGGRK